MGLQVGDNVRIVRTKRNWRYFESDLFGNWRYYFGGTTDNLPLGTVGQIVLGGHENSSYSVKFPSKKIWEFHPKELEVISEREKIMQEIESIDEHPVLEMAKERSVFVIGGKVYTPLETETEKIEQTRTKKQQLLDCLFSSEDKDKKVDNYFNQRRFFRHRRIGLTETTDLVSLDELAGARAEAERTRIVDKEVKDLETRFFCSEGCSSPDIERIKRYIVVNVFPYFAGKEYERGISRLLDPKAEHMKEVQVEANRKPLDETAKKLARYALEKLDQSRDQENISLDNLALIEGVAYRLTKSSKPTRLVIDGTNYKLVKAGFVKSLIEKRKEYLCEEILKKTREQFSEEQLGRRFLENLPNKLKVDNYGFEVAPVDEGGVFATIEVPQFLIHNIRISDKDAFRWYHFPGAEFGVQVLEGLGKISPHIFKKIGYGWQQVCIGSASFPTSGKDNGEIIGKRLDYIKSMVCDATTRDWYGRRMYLPIQERSAKDKIRESNIHVMEVGI